MSEGQTVVKCICEYNQSGRRVVFDLEPVNNVLCMEGLLQPECVVTVLAALQARRRSFPGCFLEFL